MPTVADIAEILASRDLKRFVGLKEDLFFEAKRARPYDLETARGRYELLKDASSFANASGGYLIMGLATEPVAAENTDQVISLDLLSTDHFLASKIEGVLKTHVCPVPRELVVGWLESGESPTLGVGYVYVPPQDETLKPFLMGGVLVDDEEVGAIVFGLVVRKGSSAEGVSIQTLQGWIKRGRASLEARIANIENGMAILLQNAKTTPTVPQKSLKEKLDEIARDDS
mgnify:CR=1 FL=1